MRALLLGRRSRSHSRLALAATATGGPEAQGQAGACAKANLDLIEDGRLTLATDNPAFPPWWGGGQTRKPWKTSNPYSGQGYESAVAYAVAQQLGFAKRQVDWRVVRFAQSYRPGNKNFDFYLAQVSYTPERAKDGRFLERLLLRVPVARRTGGYCHHSGDARSRISSNSAWELSSALRATSTSPTTSGRPSSPLVIRHERPRRAGSEERSDRRHRRRPPDGVLRDGRAAR